MLYRFKSRVTADVVMLEPNGRQLVEIMGKTPGQPGIVTADQIPAAIAAIEAAIAAQEAARERAGEAADENGDDEAQRTEAINLRQRAAPLIDMMRQSAAEGKEVIWEV